MAQLKEEFRKKEIFVLDLDGTIYRGTELIQGADVAVRNLLELGKKVIYLTNNASKTRESFCIKLNDMKIPCNPEQVFSSGYIAVKMLFEDYNICKIFIIGSDELVQMAESAGIPALNGLIPDEILYAPFLKESIRCDAVLCGWDIQLTYAKIRTAMELIARGAEFFATNCDTTFPAATSQKWPGTGIIVAAVESCINRSPKVIFGKPNVFGIELILRNLNEQNPGKGFGSEDAIVVGDRLETDIWQANNAGIDSLFVETGINTKDDIPEDPKTESEKKLVPTYVLPNLSDLFN
ncbi:MAG: HAD-IIA family hydrolase [Promethearchaeota archaeon]